MTLSADNLLDRIKLKSEIIKWRSLAILVATLFVASFFIKGVNFSHMKTDSIARVSIEGLILEDRKRNKKLDEIKNDKHVKAVIVYINSPGGTMVGGETLYYYLRKMAQVKPVVAVLGSIATSGGYMAALASDHILARSGTITGSIGVLMQTAEMTELSKKIGINFMTFKSGELKGSPSPLEKLPLKAEQLINASISDSHQFFVEMVKERRLLNNEEIVILSDGRIFTGRQALKSKLIDSLGGEDEALRWLSSKHNVDINLPVKDIQLNGKRMLIERFYSKVMGNSAPRISNSGVMALWN